jgi:hypothetical protein
MSILEASIKCISIGFAAGFLVQRSPNLGPDIWPLFGLLAFTAIVVLLFEFLDVEPAGRNAQRVRVDARAVGQWERGLNGR